MSYNCEKCGALVHQEGLCFRCSGEMLQKRHEIDALCRRLKDIAAGAFGWENYDTPLLAHTFEEAWIDGFLPGLRLRLNLSEEQIEPLCEFETWQAATEWLHAQGKRA